MPVRIVRMTSPTDLRSDSARSGADDACPGVPEHWACTYDAAGWSVRDTASRLGPLRVDFATGALAYRRAHGRDSQRGLGRATGKANPDDPTLIDATGGLGKDGFILACLGWRVTLLERSPLLAGLLADGVARGRHDARIGLICRRMRVLHQEATHYLEGLASAARPRVVYLDPMYPVDPGSALPGREMQYLRRLLGDAPSDPRLLVAARAAAKERVVVKRPAGAQPLSDMLPTHVIRMGGTRYDVYLTRL